MGTYALTRLVTNCKEDDSNMRALTEEMILIWIGDNLENLRGGVVPEPAPAASVNLNSRSVELFLEPSTQVNRAKVAYNCVLKLCLLQPPALTGARFFQKSVWLMWPVAKGDTTKNATGDLAYVHR